MKVLVDSSIIIDHLRNFSRQKKTKFTQIYEKCDEIYFSLISVGEVFSGKSVIRLENELRKIFDLGHIIELNVSLMENAGRIRRETGISLLDAIIAASALALNLPVASLNIKDFSKIGGLELYKI